MNKILTIGIILLFLGVGIQPSIATVEPEQPVNDDCDLCAKKVSKNHLDLINTLINRIEKNDDKLSTLSKHYPELKEKFEELLNKIESLKNQNGEINPDSLYEEDICDLIFIMHVMIVLAMTYPFFVEGDIPFFFIRNILYIITGTIGAILLIFWIPIFILVLLLDELYDCKWVIWDWPPWEE